MMDLKNYIRTIPDFPKAGILFRDITPLLANSKALHYALDSMAEPFLNAHIDVVASPEARGFIFGAAIAEKIGAGFVPIRKPNKLPSEIISYEYELEYGNNTLCIHRDAILPKQKVLIVDDVLATGGTIKACCELIKQTQGSIASCVFLIEIGALNGRQTLADYPITSKIVF